MTLPLLFVTKTLHQTANESTSLMKIVSESVSILRITVRLICPTELMLGGRQLEVQLAISREQLQSKSQGDKVDDKRNAYLAREGCTSLTYSLLYDSALV